MAAAISLTPASGSITSRQTIVRVDVTGGSSNDSSTSDSTKYPIEAEIRGYLAFLLGGVEQARSYVFTVSSDGKHSFNNFIFPDSGSWTVNWNKSSDDSQIATAAVTVS